MSLTEDESRRLGEIAAGLRRTDPRLNRALSTGRPVPRRVRTVGGAVVLTGAPLLGTGVGLQQPWLCMAGWLIVVGGVLLRCISTW